MAYAEWVRAGCPVAEKRYSLLWALKELKTEKTERSEEMWHVTAWFLALGALASGEDGGETAPLPLCEAVEASWPLNSRIEF